MNNNFHFKTKEDLAKFAIRYYFSHQQIPEVKKNEILQGLQKKEACFISIYIDDNLRGCIGSYIAAEPLYLNIIKNSIKAAFSDYRFPALQKYELGKLQVAVSVLSPLSEFKLQDTKHLLEFLEKEKPGVLIEKEGNKALFLPQVWEKLSDPADFLSHLCQKAGLSPLSWQEKDLKYWIFEAK